MIEWAVTVAALIPIISFLIWLIKRYIKSIIITEFSTRSHAENTNLCVESLSIYNRKNKKITIKSIDLVLFDKTKKYTFELEFDEQKIELDIDSEKEIRIKPVSFYYTLNEQIEISQHLFIQNTFFIRLHTADNKEYKSYSTSNISLYKKIKLYLHRRYLRNKYFYKSKNTIKIRNAVCKYKGVVYSPKFIMGISYINQDNNAEVGFFGEYLIINGRLISMPPKDIPLANFIFSLLEKQGCRNIIVESLNTSHTHIGKNINIIGAQPLKEEVNNKEIPTINLSKDALSFEINQD